MGRTRPGRPVAIGAWPVLGGAGPVPARRALDDTEVGVRAVWRLTDRPAPAGTPVGPAGRPAAGPRPGADVEPQAVQRYPARYSVEPHAVAPLRTRSWHSCAAVGGHTQQCRPSRAESTPDPPRPPPR